MKLIASLIESAGTVATTFVLLASTEVVPAQEGPGTAPESVKVVDSVRSKDGTTIAYEKCGKGPMLILVGPALSDRSDATRLAALLAPTFTVINYDRRGRGGSGDAKTYATEREIEDIEALIDKFGASVFLFGSSSGAVLALEAANKLMTKVKAQVLFEPPFIVDNSRPAIPKDFFAEIGKLVSADRRGDAVAQFMTQGIGVPEEMVLEMRRAPMWTAMEKKAHTLIYDGAILSGLQAGKPLPTRRWISVTAHTLVLDGERSDAFLRNAAQALTEVLPSSKRQTLTGQDHSAVFTAPQSLVPVLVRFFGAEAAGKLDKKSEETAGRG